jgi:O-antigen/teichoic acid export membrane protein
MSQLSLAMAITLPLGLVTKILVPRTLGREQAGILFFAEMFPTLALSLIPMGIPVYIAKTVPPRHEHASEIFATVTIFGAIVATMAVLGLMGYLRLANYDSLTIRVTAIMGCSHAMSVFWNEYLLRFFLVTGRFALSSILSVAAKLTTVTLILLCLWLKPELEWVAAAFLAAQIIVLIATLHKARQIGFMSQSFNLTRLRRILGVGLPFLFSGVVAGVNASVDSFSLERLASFEELGFYSTSQRLLGILMLLTPLLGQAFGPTLSRLYVHDRAAFATMASTVIRTVVVAAFPMALGLIVFNREILQLLYGEQFIPARYSLIAAGPLLILVYLATFVAITASTATSGKFFSLALALGVVLNLCGNWLMIPAGAAWLGKGGAAAGATVATVIATASDTIFLSWISGVRVIDRRALHAIVIGVSLTILCGVTSPAWMPLDLSIRIAAFVILVPALLIGLRLITASDLQALRTAARRK